MSADSPAAAAPEPGGISDHGRRFLILWIGLSVIATPLVAIFVGPEIPPGNGSVMASGQVLDNTVLVAALTPVLLFVILFVGFALSHFRANAADAEADGPPDRGDSGIQVLWAVGTTVIVLGLAVFGSYQLVADGAGGGQGPSAAFKPAGYANAMDVQVIGQQWEFTYRYPSYGGLETPHLVLPANTLIRLHVTSLDVVHSFWAFQLGVKADANPGTDNVVYVKVKGPRSFEIRCAELCGLWHGYMFDTGEVVTPAAFAAWIKTEQNLFAPLDKYLPPYATSYLPEPVHRAG
jgi:cytochrome c oxidase subunit 2